MYTGEVAIQIDDSRSPDTCIMYSHGIPVLCNPMDLYSGNRQAAVDRVFENKSTSNTTFINKSYYSQIWNPSRTLEETHGNHIVTNQNITRLDFNSNNGSGCPIIKQQISSTTSSEVYFQPKQQQPHFHNIISHGRSINFDTLDPSLPLPKYDLEQTEPIDLSCRKKTNSKANKNSHYRVKAKNYFKSKAEMSLSLQPNISEATLLILKSVYDVKYHRKPNCDMIFLEDPVDPKLYVCKVCSKHVRSKWHHFQTHYSRDHKCADCDAVYSRIDTLRTHAKKRHHTVIPRYYYGIPANIWHRVVVQCPDSARKPLPTP